MAFKESMSAFESANAIEKGIKEVLPDARIIKLPIADGGDSTLEVLIKNLGGKIFKKKVKGPLGKPVLASWGILKDKKTAVIELAEASGLRLVPKDKRNPLYTTTYGVGELIKEALKYNIKRIIIGLGGSATVDGGAGILQALDVKLLDKRRREIQRGGRSLKYLEYIDTSNIDKRFKKIEIIAAVDVVNPLLGKNGAAYVYGSQKGGTPYIIKELENALRNYAFVLEKQLGRKVINFIGAGAAGGVAIALKNFLNAKVILGAKFIIDMLKIEQMLKKVDIVMTGEGSVDIQSTYGKGTFELAKLAKKHKVPVIFFAANVGDKYQLLNDYNIMFVPITSNSASKESIKKGKELLKIAVKRICRN